MAVAELFAHTHKDIAVLKLAERVTQSAVVTPICLPMDADPWTGQTLELHMCKRPTNKAVSRKSRVSFVSVTPMANHDCSIMFHRKRAQFSGAHQMCAFDETGDTCTGDLGGPLSGKINGRHVVVGLMSYINTKVMEGRFFGQIFLIVIIIMYLK